jgi:hypothetical protein
MIRHLLHHIYPRIGSPWRQGLLRIREAFPLFNGRKIIGVTYDGTTEHPNMVNDAMSGSGAEIFHLPNNPDLREVTTFESLFSRVSDLTGPEHVTLYSHCKGVTRPPDSTCHRWAEVMAEICFDWRTVGPALASHPVAGPFKKLGQGWPSHESMSQWHYSGSWYWFRNADLFAKDWKRIDGFWGGIEPYPSLHFGVDEAANLFHELPRPDVQLYNHHYWRDNVEPDFDRWKAARPAGPECRSLNLGCGPHRFPDWHNVDIVRMGTIQPDEVINGGLPWPDGWFERAYLGHMIEHVRWESVPEMLRQVKRVVRSGGEVVVVAPDFKVALAALLTNPDTQGALSHVWEIAEDYLHRQSEDVDTQWAGARHQWNSYGERVVWAMKEAGYSEVTQLELTIDNFGLPWPVVDYTNLSQCAVKARVP